MSDFDLDLKEHSLVRAVVFGRQCACSHGSRDHSLIIGRVPRYTACEITGCVCACFSSDNLEWLMMNKGRRVPQ